MTQETMILEYLKTGQSLTPIDALNYFQCWRLGARCHALKRKGFPIKTRLIKNKNKHYAEYYLSAE